MITPWKKLEMLLEHHSFELLEMPVDPNQREDLHIIYLMNDAAESFLVLKNAKMTGEYDPEFDGETEGFVAEAEQGYVLVLRRGNDTASFFFDDLVDDTHLYNYGKNGHFWIRGFEYLRQIEYKVSIISDKYNYLGEESCTEGEKKLASLKNFPPLNYTHYPASPLKYIESLQDPWRFSKEAYDVMRDMCRKSKDSIFGALLFMYKIFPTHIMAWIVSRKLRCKKHADLVDNIIAYLKEEAKAYPKRVFDEEKNSFAEYRNAAKELKAIYEARGFKSEVYYEEPFQFANDDTHFAAYVLSYENHHGLRESVVRRIGEI